MSVITAIADPWIFVLCSLLFPQLTPAHCSEDARVSMLDIIPGEERYTQTCIVVIKNTVRRDKSPARSEATRKLTRFDTGPVVRYGPSRLLINTNTVVKEIYFHGANNAKSKAYQALVNGAPNTLTIRNKEDHSWRRRILSQAFDDARMLSYQDILLRHISALCGNLEDNAKYNQEKEAGDSVILRRYIIPVLGTPNIK